MCSQYHQQQVGEAEEQQEETDAQLPTGGREDLGRPLGALEELTWRTGGGR